MLGGPIQHQQQILSTTIELCRKERLQLMLKIDFGQSMAPESICNCNKFLESWLGTTRVGELTLSLVLTRVRLEHMPG